VNIPPADRKQSDRTPVVVAPDLANPTAHATEVSDAAFAAALSELLRSSETGLDFVLRNRLSAARARALDGSRGLLWSQWHVVGSAVAGGVMLLTLMFGALRQSPPPALSGRSMPMAASSVSDNRLSAVDIADFLDDGGDRIAVYENLDFYQWYAEADGNA
jgi:hypothetical protein